MCIHKITPLAKNKDTCIFMERNQTYRVDAMGHGNGRGHPGEEKEKK